MDPNLIIPLSTSAQPMLTEVGGKGSSLIRMTEAGLPVPHGAILTTEFFRSWFEEIQESVTFRTLTSAPAGRWPALCGELKQKCKTLVLSKTQQQNLSDLQDNLVGQLFAVRSSSPEEDLDSKSFAGGYETRLGVRPGELEEAVRHCFASSFDERVLVYKREHGFDAMAPSMAVVVQQQIRSDVAGVGFSINPLSNDYDEALIEGNWGLGESVVAGLVSPDSYIISKVDGHSVEKNLGTKQRSIHLGADGGTVEREDDRSAEFCLTDGQLTELTEVLCRIEGVFERPVDIEWAYADGRLHLLQARPITTYVPLPPELVTKPGERRRLYADGALSDGLTTNEPVSPMGLDWMETLFKQVAESIVGPINADPAQNESLLLIAGGRPYLNLSIAMRLTDLKKMTKSAEIINVLMAEIASNADADRYRAAEKPQWLRWRLLLLIPRVLWRLRAYFWNFARNLLAPQTARRAYQRRAEAYEMEFTRNLDYSLPLDAFQARYSPLLARALVEVSMPALVAFMVGLMLVDPLVRGQSAEVQALGEKLKLGFTGNVVVEMGIALFRLAKLLDPSDLGDLPGLSKRIADRQMTGQVMDEWDAFIAAFGARGPMEMDLASPRYGDDPGLALRQISFMSVDDDAFDPEVAHTRQVEERRQAYKELMSHFGWFRRMVLRRTHRIIDLFAGTRDTPKHQMVLYNHAVRKRLLMEGGRLLREGRLDAAAQVFDLKIQDLEAADVNPSLDLREVCEERTRFLKILKAQVTEFPHVIDSRGRILRPPARESRPGELTGTAISPGVVTGPVKILRSPHEKTVEKGDVLVAYTTDPGWTPLFVNAAAVVLEVGGILQHGAVVAREYGKPCVAGIDQVMSKLRDGQRVEVDGIEGVIRILTQDPENGESNQDQASGTVEQDQS